MCTVVYTVSARAQNVVFHSGRELTSDDVSYNLTRATDPTKTSPNSLIGLAKPWTHQVVDKYTVVLSSEQSRVGAFDFLTQIWVGDKNTIESGADKNQAIGTGPFTFDEWIQGDHVAFTKNSNYWLTGAAVSRWLQRVFRARSASHDHNLRVWRAGPG